MTKTLTTDRQQFEEWVKFHSDEEECTNLLEKNNAGTNYLHPHTDLAWIAWKTSRELLANRGAQPVGFTSDSFMCELKNSGVVHAWLRRDADDPGFSVKLYTAPPAPVVNPELTGATAVPDICSTAVNDAAWKLHDTLTEHGPLNGHQFNNLKGCFYEALKIVMNAVPAPIVPVMICDTCGHDADHQGNRTYKCDSGHAFHIRSEPVSQGYKLAPVEPTPKQWAAGVKAMDSGMDKVTLVYKAMLATAPTQGENQ